MPSLVDPLLIPIGAHIFIGVVLVLVTALPSNQFRHAFVCSALTAVLAILPVTSSGIKCVDWGTGTVVSSYLLLYTCFFILSDAETQFWRAGCRFDDLQIAKKSYIGRLSWSFTLWTSFRGVGWNWRISKMPDTVSEDYSVRLDSCYWVPC
jgi:hypothetical protein